MPSQRPQGVDCSQREPILKKLAQAAVCSLVCQLMQLVRHDITPYVRERYRETVRVTEDGRYWRLPGGSSDERPSKWHLALDMLAGKSYSFEGCKCSKPDNSKGFKKLNCGNKLYKVSNKLKCEYKDSGGKVYYVGERLGYELEFKLSNIDIETNIVSNRNGTREDTLTLIKIEKARLFLVEQDSNGIVRVDCGVYVVSARLACRRNRRSRSYGIRSKCENVNIIELEVSEVGAGSAPVLSGALESRLSAEAPAG